MINRKELELLFKKHGYTDYKWIEPKEIVVSQWVRMHCIFGCGDYGRNASCPPNLPSISECRDFFNEYKDAAIFHFEKKVAKPKDRHSWSKKVNRQLLKVEREAFLSGYQKTFLLFMDSCNLCAECLGQRNKCKDPKSSRPSPEAMGIDVFSTVRKYKYPIEVLSDYSQQMNRYAFLFVD